MHKQLNLSEILALYRMPENMDHELVDPASPVCFDRVRDIEARVCASGVRRGQIWLAADQCKAMPVFVHTVFADGSVQVLPMSVEERAVTEDTIIVERTPLGEAAFCWMMPAIIPATLLVSPYGELRAKTVRALCAGDPMLADPRDRAHHGTTHPDHDMPGIRNREDTLFILFTWWVKFQQTAQGAHTPVSHLPVTWPQMDDFDRELGVID